MREQRRLSHMVKGSGNWVKQKRRIAKLAAKVGNQRADFLHKTANRLAARYDCVGVEDLDMKNMSQSLTLGKSTMTTGTACSAPCSHTSSNGKASSWSR